MNFTTSSKQSVSSWTAWTLAGALLLGLCGSALVGASEPGTGSRGYSGPNTGDETGGGGFAADDEYIGTLPTRGDDEPEGVPFTAPGFVISGPRSSVNGAVYASTGSGFAVIEVLEAGGPAGHSGPHPNDLIEMTFAGQVSLQIDAGVMESCNVQVGVNSANVVGSTFAQAMTEQNLLLSTVVPANAILDMPLADFSRAGFLQEGIHLLTYSREFGRDQMDISALGGIIMVDQGQALGQ
jgi:hypothetical protein